MTGSIEIVLAGPTVTIHGLFELPLQLHFLTAGIAEETMRRVAVGAAAELRREAISTSTPTT